MINPSIGLKLMFENAHQSLVGIEIFMIGDTLKKRMQYILQREFIIGQGKVTYSQINALMGPTNPPKIMSNLATLDYEGASFMFKYSLNIDAHSLMTTENTLAKIAISCDHKSIIDRFKRGKLSSANIGSSKNPSRLRDRDLLCK